MSINKADLVIIGGGPAGMSAAVAAYDAEREASAVSSANVSITASGFTALQRS